MNDKTKQLTKREDAQMGVIQTIDSQWRLAQYLASSTFLPSAYNNNPSNVMAVMTTAADYGIGAGQATEAFFPIEQYGWLQKDGKKVWGVTGVTIGMYAKTILALVQRNPEFADIKYEWGNDDKDEWCVVSLTRDKRGREISITEKFTIQDAIDGGYYQTKDGKTKHNWATKKKDMLFARAVSRAARRLFADVMIGIYSVEELSDSQTSTPAKIINNSDGKEYTSRLSQMSDQLKSKVGDSDVIDVEDEAIEDNIVIEDDTVVVDGLTSDIEMTERYATRMKWLNGMIDKSNADNSFKLSDKHIDAIQSYIQDEYASPSHLTDIKNGAILLGIE